MLLWRTKLADDYVITDNNVGGRFGGLGAQNTQHHFLGNEKGHVMVAVDPTGPAVPVTVTGGSIHGDVFKAETAGAAMTPFATAAAKTVTVRNVTNKAIRVAFTATPAEYIIISPNLSEDIHVVANADELSVMRDDAAAALIRVETILHG